MARPPRSRSTGFQPLQFANHGITIDTPGGGVSAVQLAAYARRATQERPYGVVNDYIGSALGMTIGAPVPPSTLVDLGGEWGHVSLGFGQRGVQPPPASFAQLARERPWEATGIIILDQWILNTDRHDENIAYLPALGAVAAFDHDSALIGQKPPNGAVASLSVGMNERVYGHELAQHLSTGEFLHPWISRVRTVSPHEIQRHVYLCFDLGLLTVEERDKLIDFLLFRRTYLGALIEASRQDFPAIDSWPLSAGGAT